MSNRVCKKCDGTGSLLVEYLGAERWAICDCTKQTLFEAAKDAPDGTRFKSNDNDIFVKTLGTLKFEDDGCIVGLHILELTDFEIIPPGPRKRDVGVNTLTSTHRINVPDDLEKECVEAFKLIGRLTMWEGAQIGKPGYAAGRYLGEAHPVAHYLNKVSLYQVTFETPEQCIAAWQAEWSEALK